MSGATYGQEFANLCGIAKEKDGCVVRNDVPVSFVCAKLDTETPRIPSAIVRAGLSADGGEADANRTFVASLAEEFGKAEVIERLRAPVVSVSASTFGVDHTFWNTLSIEVRDEVNEVEVLEQ